MSFGRRVREDRFPATTWPCSGSFPLIFAIAHGSIPKTVIQDEVSHQSNRSVTLDPYCVASRPYAFAFSRYALASPSSLSATLRLFACDSSSTASVIFASVWALWFDASPTTPQRGVSHLMLHHAATLCLPVEANEPSSHCTSARPISRYALPLCAA